MKLMILLFIVPAVFVRGRGSDECFDGKPCPPNLPYCTRLGCAFQCPDQYFLNGTYCVDTCGEMYADYATRRCVNSCGDGMLTFSQIQAIGSKLRRVETCLHTCQVAKENHPHLYRYNETCVEACPGDALFLLNDTCVTECPSEYPLRLNKTQANVFIGTECRTNCDGNPINGHTLEDSGYCVNQCSDANMSLMHYKHCTHQCPPSEPLRVPQRLVMMVYPLYDNLFCMPSCPAQTFSFKSTCVENCPEEAPYVTNGTCTNRCPPDEMFLKNISGQSTFCLSDCTEIIYNGYCVPGCPEALMTYNNACVEQCPESAPLKESSSFNGNELFTCVTECPAERYAYKGMCVDTCPASSFAFKNNCLETCPATHPFSSTINMISFSSFQTLEFEQCVSQCSVMEFQYNMKCLLHCPLSVPFVYNSTCLPECPESAGYMLQCEKLYSTVPTNYFPTNTVNLVFEKCVDKCPDNINLYNSTCVTNSPVEARLETLCGRMCPSDLFQVHGGYNCVRKCRIGEVLEDFMCKSYCEHTPIVFNGTCLKACPMSHPLMSWKRGRFRNVIDCKSNCSDNEYEYNSTCVKEGECYYPVSTDGTKECSDHCPESHPYRMVEQCLGICPDSKVVHDFTCIAKCPKSDPYISNKTCTQSCSSFQQISPQGIRCLPECPYNSFLINSTVCTRRCPDSEPYIVDTRCAKRCPRELMFINETKDGRRCVSACDTYSTEERLCKHRCPKESQYIDGTICRSRCPGKLKYNSASGKMCLKICGNNQLREGNECFDKCEDRKILLNGKCVYKYECDSAFNTSLQFDGRCLAECPGGYSYNWSSPGGCISSAVYWVLFCSFLSLFSIHLFCYRQLLKDMTILQKAFFARMCKKEFPFYKYRLPSANTARGADTAADTAVDVDEENLNSTLSSVPTVVRVQDYLTQMDEQCVTKHDEGLEELETVAAIDCGGQDSQDPQFNLDFDQTELKLMSDYKVECLVDIENDQNSDEFKLLQE